MLSRSGLQRVLLFGVVQLPGVTVSEQRVVVEVELGVYGQDLAVAGDGQRIDLGEGAVERLENPIQACKKGGDGAGQLRTDTEAVGELSRLVRLEAQQRVYRRA